MATGDVFFESVWPTISGNIAATDPNSRGLAAAASVTTGGAQSFFWTDDGTEDGDEIYLADVDACPWPVVMMRHGQGYGLVCCYGPIMSPQDQSLAASLYAWRLEWNLSKSRWEMEIYAGGVDGFGGVGYLDDSGKGRQFQAMIASG
jgi:hypothetical protein